MKKIVFFLLFPLIFFAKDFQYDIKPIKIAKNSYYVYGKEEYFSKQNGGNIANTAFIETKNSIILIDTGSSYLYGKELKKQIEKLTKKPIKFIINTHHHPDHFLGNNAFSDATFFSTQFTADEIKTNGDLYIENLSNIVGVAMKDTKIKNIDNILEKKVFNFDGYKLNFYYLEGHTKSDVVIFDEKTKVLYASDLVFNKRALATPHANIKQWIKNLEIIKKIPFKVCIPGHGVAFKSNKEIDENIAYLEFLEKTFTIAANKGLDIYEVLEVEIPKYIKNFSMFEEEFERTVINLYPKYEKRVIK